MNPFRNSSSKPQHASSFSRSSGTKGFKVNDSLFELHKPRGTPQMQVLFFHGLQLVDSSDPHLSTWGCGDGSCWPQTWLVKKFPGAHVLTVSYNGRIKRDSEGALDMYLVGENLTSDLLQAGIGQLHDCPVIMVGHSFGGLVIKRLYCEAHRMLHRSKDGFQKARLKKFLGNIRGIFYYATPQYGSELVAELAEIQVNPLLEYFQTLSTKAARLNSEFDTIRESGQYATFDVYGLGEGLKLKLRGFREEKVVSEASARVENFYTVSGADHYTICKPENETSASFSKLANFLGDIATAVEVEANSRKEANSFDNRQILPENIVGIEAPVEEVIDKLGNAARVGIVGMGGLGKTTLAKALFNKLGAQFERFEYSCFVFEMKNIQGNMERVKEEVWKLMYRRGKKVGKEETWSSLKEKRLFLVLDDISSDSDLTILSGIVKETSPESRFVVTSREIPLTRKLDYVFPVSFLDKSVARQLFVSHAFGEEKEPEELQSAVDKIVGRCDGLPLSLEVVGLSLYKRRSPEDWEQTERALVNAGDVSNLNEKLWATLRVSYDRLTKTEQDIFLDITTFFSGNRNWTLRDAKAAWGIRFHTLGRLLWQTLVDLSLVYNVEEDETIKVHEQLQSLGRKIASEQRRVWDWSVGLQLLQKTHGLDEQIIYSLRLEEEVDTDEEDDDSHEEIQIARSSLQRLKDLHYLDVDKMVPRIIIDGAQGCDSLSTKLVLLHCYKPQLSQVLLHSTLSESLVGLKLGELTKLCVPKEVLHFRYSALRSQRSGLVRRHQTTRTFDRTNLGLAECTPWSTTDQELTATAPIDKMLHKIWGFSQLEVLELWDCPCSSLPETFGQLFKLRHLSLECPELHNLPETFGQLKAVSKLKFMSCRKLQSLSESFGELSSLNNLEFYKFYNLENLPESFGQLKALTKLEFIYCRKLESLSESFGELSSLNHLKFWECGNLDNLPDSFGQLKALTKLEFMCCRKLQSLCESFGELSSLNHLEFKHCDNLENLPESFGELSSLNRLQLYHCDNLETLPESFGELSSLNHLKFWECDNLENLPKSFGQLQALSKLEIWGCKKLQSLSESFGELSSLNHLEFYKCDNLEDLPKSFAQLRALTKLEFVYCRKLQSLSESFGELSWLNHLKFYECDNLEILPKSFGQLRALTKLEFSYCRKLQCLPESFGELSSLNHLEFEQCDNLQNLPESFGQLKALTKLEFSYCRKLQSLSESFGELSSLNHLNFWECDKLENLPESFGQLKALSKLEVWTCKTLQSLSESFGELSLLNHLEFYKCDNLENLSKSFGQLKALTKLEFSYCRKLQSLSESFGELSSLNHLKFWECDNLENLPESFGQLKALSKLEIWRCRKLQSLSKSFGELSSLNHLEFHKCDNLENLPESFGQLKALTKLEFSYCRKLQSLSELFGELSSLNHLEFYECDNLENLPESFGQLKALTKLEFSSCRKLQSLPESFGELSSLNHLEFEQCDNLENLPESFGQLKDLSKLEFSYCRKLQSLPESFGELSSLNHLEFEQCDNLENLPKSFRQLKALSRLQLRNCSN